MRFTDELCLGIACNECPFEEKTGGCLLAERFEEVTKARDEKLLKLIGRAIRGYRMMANSGSPWFNPTDVENFKFSAHNLEQVCEVIGDEKRLDREYKKIRR